MLDFLERFFKGLKRVGVERVEYIFDNRGPFLAGMLLVLVLGFLLIGSGIKIRKKNKKMGWIYIVLGAVFSVFIIYIILYSMLFGRVW